MKEGSRLASPVFKKRFARRKTTQRPFTFARSFENGETSSAAGNSVVSQVGDRGVIITSPVQLSKSNKDMTISEIVRQSPVPVLIAHSTPKEKQKEKSDDEDEDEANNSLLRRSFRSREPSEKFLNRLQYPHGTPQHVKPYHKPDECYIGSKNTSNIDAEVSFADGDGPARGLNKGISASTGKASQKRVKAQAGKKSTGPSTSRTKKMQSLDKSHSEDNSSSSRVASTKRSSHRKATSASTTSKRKGRGQAVLEKTPPQSPVQEVERNHSDRTKRSTSLSVSKRNKDKDISLNSSGSPKSAAKSKTPQLSISKGNKSGGVSSRGSETKKAVAKRRTKGHADRKRSETVALIRDVDKTLTPNENESFSSVYEDQVSSQADMQSTQSESSKSDSSSQSGEQKTLSQKEKENRPLNKNRKAASPHPPQVSEIDIHLSPSESSESDSSSRSGKQKMLPQKGKENRPLNKNRKAASPHSSPASQVDKHSSPSGSSESDSSSQLSEQKMLPQKEKENRPLNKSRKAASPHPSPKGKRSKSVESSPSGSRQKHRLISGSHAKDRNHSNLETSTSSLKRTSQSEQGARRALSPAKKRKTVTANTSVYSNVTVRLSPIRENEIGNDFNTSIESGNASDDLNRGKDSMKTSSATLRKRIALDDNSSETSGPSPVKKAKDSPSQQPETSIPQNQSINHLSLPSSRLSSSQSKKGKSPLLTTSGSQASKKNKRTNWKSGNDSQNHSKSIFQSGSDVHKNASGLKTSDFNSSNKPVASSANKSTEKVVAHGTVRGKMSPRRIASKSTNSFWKTSRPNERKRSKTQLQNASVSSVYDDQSFGEADASSVEEIQEIMRRGASKTGPGSRKSYRSGDDKEGPRRPYTDVTEVGVIIDMLEDTEEDVMEERDMSGPCQKIVHQAFTFTKKQLRETESQLKQIAELGRQVNKLKSACKAMSGESKEKIQQKFILQKELQSLKSRGIDSDMMRIDQWLRDFQLLRQTKVNVEDV